MPTTLKDRKPSGRLSLLKVQGRVLAYRTIEGGVYVLHEPRLTGEERERFERLKAWILDRLTPDTLRERRSFYLKAIRKIYSRGLVRRRPPDEETTLKIYYYIIRDVEGLGPLTPLLRDPEVEDITLSYQSDRPVLSVYLSGRGLTSTNIQLSEEEVRRLIFRLAEKCNRTVNLLQPELEGKLAEGVRVQAFLGREVSEKGSHFTIRKPVRRPTLRELVGQGSLSPLAASYLWLVVTTGVSGLIVGEVGSGKTTLLNALLHLIPGDRRIVTLEDTPEISIDHSNWVPLTARPGYGVPDTTGRRPGEISLMDLIPSVLRMRPDYTVIGEVRRAEEARALLEVVTIGSTGLTTFHSSSLESALARLLNMGLDRRQVSLFRVWILVKALKEDDKLRRVVWEICEYDGRSLKPVFKRGPAGLDMAVSPGRSLVVRLAAERAGMSPEEVWSVVERKADEYGR